MSTYKQRKNQNIKPCPFCGATLYHSVQNFYYQCKTKGCFLNTHFVSESEVVAWNTRDTALMDEIVAAIESLESWSKAYPLEVFPEPDLKKAHKVLTENGMTLDAISAYVTRHVIKSVEEITKAILDKVNQQK